MIETAETFYNRNGIMGIKDNGTDIPVPLWVDYFFGEPGGAPAAGFTDDPVAVAFINRGKWKATCPFGCGTTVVVSDSDRRFFCAGPSGCRNWSVNHKMIPVVWPDATTRQVIEDLLNIRPQVFQNWNPDESVDQLRQENEERGPVA